METIVKKLYEGMFIVDAAEAAADWDGIIKTIRHTLERADAEIVSIRKWDERRFAYKIGHKERGTYVLCYFRAPGSKIEGVERDVQLSERIMRVLVLNVEHMSQEDIEKDTPAVRADKKRQEAIEKAKDRLESERAGAEQVGAEETGTEQAGAEQTGGEEAGAEQAGAEQAGEQEEEKDREEPPKSPAMDIEGEEGPEEAEEPGETAAPKKTEQTDEPQADDSPGTEENQDVSEADTTAGSQ